MKKKLLIAILAMIMTSSVYAQYFPVDTARLNLTYKSLMENPKDPVAQKNYFDAFPDTWDKFIMTYQYFPNKEYDLSMFFRASDHVAALYDLNTIPDSIYCRKLIHLAIGGKINPDVAHDWWGLKPLLRWGMKTKMDTMFTTLSKLRKGHQFEFWAFYWSNMYYRKEIYDEFGRLKLKGEKLYPKETEIMSDAFKYFHNGVNYVGMGFEKEDISQE